MKRKNIIYGVLIIFFFSAERLPVDEVNANFVRTVKNCIFSKSPPTPLRGPLRLAALSEVEPRHWLYLFMIFYDSRSICNGMHSTGCAWGDPERGRECSQDGWVPAVCQRWQSAARICSSGAQIRWSSGRVCFHSCVEYPALQWETFCCWLLFPLC